MDFLHTVFEDQLELQPDAKGNIVIGDTVFSPVAILRADEAAYREEFSKWLSDRWLPEQNEMLEQILNVHANRKRFADLCTTLKNGHLVPLVGSGMSIPTGLSAWSGFLRALRLHSSMSEKELEDLLSKWAYEEAAECLAAAMPGRLFDERIEHDLRIDDPEDICGSVEFLPELFDKLVLTTNLDDLLERMYEVRDHRFSHVLSGCAIGEYRRVKASSERILLKFHGDCRSRDGRVLGKTEYDKAYTNGTPIREELTTIYRTHSILCIGCSLNPDRTVGLLAEVAKLDPGMPKHYAFLQRPSDTNMLRKREHFLTERDVFPIWYPGDHDESIQGLFVGMMQYMGRL
jgi:hypothetical protein